MQNSEFDKENNNVIEVEKQTEKSTTVPVIEEQLEVHKEKVKTGKVSISKSVSEDQKSFDIPLMHDEVDVERIEINTYVDALPAPVRYEGDIMIIPVLKEVVEKRTILVEEIRVKKRQVQTQEQKQVTLKKEEVKVDRNS